METSYWVAAHLTGIFEIKDQSDNILEKGSLGAGMSINRGVITTIRQIKENKMKILFNGVQKSPSEANVTIQVINLLISEGDVFNIQISHQFEVPLSSGYGASAAGALGTAYSLNDYLELGLSDIELFQIAHKAEVLTRSGLGDVIGLFQGGLEIRIKEGAPGIGKTIQMTNDNKWKIATVHLGEISTSTILSNPQKRDIINKAGKKLVSQLILNPNFSNFVQYASIFSHKANLWSSRLKKLIELIPNEIVVSQIMLGEGLFLFYQEETNLMKISIPNLQINKEAICHDTVVRLK